MHNRNIFYFITLSTFRISLFCFRSLKYFFNVSKFPTAAFEITKVSEENGKQMVEGNLTIKEATHAIKFPATVTVTDADVTIASDEFEIDRTKWAVNYNSGSVVKDLAGDKVINDNIKLKLAVKATK